MEQTGCGAVKCRVVQAVTAGAVVCVTLLLIEFFLVFPSTNAGRPPLQAGYLLAVALLTGAALSLFILFNNRCRHVKSELERKEEHFRKAFQSDPEAVSISRLADGVYVEVNKGFTRLTGFEPEEVVGESSLEIPIWANTEDRKRFVHTLVSTGETKNFETVMRMKDGRQANVLISGRIEQLEGAPHLLAVTRDITDMKAAQEAKLKSQEKYARIFENVQDIYYEATTKGILLDISPSVKAILGYEPQEVIGKPIVDYYADPAKRGEFVKGLTTGGEVLDYQVVLKNKNGGTTRMSVNAKMIPDAATGDFRYCGSIRDVELQHRAQEALAASEAKYRALVEHANSLILRLDRAGRVLFLNEYALEFFGYGFGELLGREARGLIFPAEDADGHPLVSFPPPSGGPREACVVVAEVVKKDGERAWVNWSVRVDHDDEGAALALLCVGNDITAQAEAERKVQLMEAHLAQSQKFEALGTLASGIAHDFNNVLSAIIGYAELSLMSIPEGNRARDHQNAILAAGSRAAKLVRQILTFARRSEENQTTIVQLAPLTREVVKFLRASLPANIEIRQRIEGDGAVEADPTRIHQVLMNLCTNAVKAMPEGGVITVTVKRRTINGEATGDEATVKPGEYYLLTVADTGVGMTPQIRARAFDPFFTTRPTEGGTGMGLAVVQGIVADLGGRVMVDSAPGEGSAFRIYLPLASPDAVAAETSEGEEPRGSESILLIEDERPIADATARNLETLGYSVTVVLNAGEAISLFGKSPGIYDLIIADMTMPGMTGDVLVTKLRAISAELPVVVCSGFSERMTPEKAINLNVAAYLQKPLTRGQLARAVRKALDGG